MTPISIMDWAKTNRPTEDMFFCRAWASQMEFICNDIPFLFPYPKGLDSLEHLAFLDAHQHWLSSLLTVVDTHRSKSIVLPVVCLNLLASGIKVTFRNNFHDWSVAVASPIEIDADFLDLWDYDVLAQPYIGFEGFPKDTVYAPYSKNKKNFSFYLAPNNYRLYTFLFILSAWLRRKEGASHAGS
jgi:hypothetical protein